MSEIIAKVAGRRDDLPRYHQLSNILTQRIESGVYEVGDLLPTEIELCEAFELSRHTVREALRRLIDAGLVKRRQGSGTQVVASRAQSSYVHSMRSVSGLFQYAADTVFRVDRVEVIVPEDDVTAYLDGPAGASWLYVEGVRRDRDGSSPICFTRVFIDQAFEGVATDLANLSGMISTLIERRYAVSVEDVEQEIRSEPMPKYAARQLGISTRTWAVRVIRRYFDGNGKIVQVSLNYHPADRFSYTMHLRREGPKGWP